MDPVEPKLIWICAFVLCYTTSVDDSNARLLLERAGSVDDSNAQPSAAPSTQVGADVKLVACVRVRVRHVAVAQGKLFGRDSKDGR